MSNPKYLTQLQRKINKHFDEEEFRTLCFELGISDYENIPGRTKINKIRELIARFDRMERLPELIANCTAKRPHVTWSYEAHLFIAYKQSEADDKQLAHYLKTGLQKFGHHVFIDQDIRSGEEWLERIDAELKAAGFLIVLLSEKAGESEMVRSEVQQAFEYRKKQGHPHTLPVRVNYEGMLPYAIAAFLNDKQYITWQTSADNEPVALAIQEAVQNRLPDKPDPFATPTQDVTLSEDGRFLTQPQQPTPPLPEFDPRLLARLTAPGGAVRLRDKFYVERDADADLKQEIIQWGSTITIRAPRQTGKTSLLMRGLHHARQSGAEVVFIDGQSLGLDEQSKFDPFLRGLAETLCDELGVDVSQVDQVWNGRLGSQKKLTNLIEDHILPQFNVPIVLAFDEADALLTTRFYQHFFGLLRIWHNRRAMWPEWEKFNIALVISTEPYLLIDDINQSPFNVGLKLDLSDFDRTQFEQLNVQHGSPLDETAVTQAFNLLNGQPYLTRKLLYLTAVKQKTWTQIEAQATLDNGDFGDHLRRLYWGIRTQPTLQQALLQIIRTRTCSDEDALFRLQKAGLATQTGDVVTCRCGLYGQYFEHKLT